MKRDCKLVASSPNGKKAVYVDKINEDKIMSYLHQDDRHKKKFQHFIQIFFGGHRVPSIYDKEDINNKCKDVTAIKFFKGQENDRIYCKEVVSSVPLFATVMVALHERKTSQKNSNKEIVIIEKVAEYEYEIK